jgi:mono/diheme cytochrome c family protein
MPSFALLSDRERSALVAYVKTFRTEPEAPGAAIAIPADPFEGDAQAAVAVGRATFHGLAKCWSCHPAFASPSEIAGFHQAAKLPAPQFRPLMFESLSTDSTWGRPLRAPDFWMDRIKTGIDVDNLARIIGAGVGGTAMPSWASALTAEQLWGLAYYVHDLALMRGTPEAARRRAQLLAQEKSP